VCHLHPIWVCLHCSTFCRCRVKRRQTRFILKLPMFDLWPLVSWIEVKYLWWISAQAWISRRAHTQLWPKQILSRLWTRMPSPDRLAQSCIAKSTHVTEKHEDTGGGTLLAKDGNPVQSTHCLQEAVNYWNIRYILASYSSATSTNRRHMENCPPKHLTLVWPARMSLKPFPSSWYWWCSP
jgi:hypothetical protein